MIELIEETIFNERIGFEQVIRYAYDKDTDKYYKIRRSDGALYTRAAGLTDAERAKRGVTVYTYTATDIEVITAKA